MQNGVIITRFGNVKFNEIITPKMERKP